MVLSGSVTYRDSKGTKRTYDSSGRLTRVKTTSKSGGNKTVTTTTYSYDENGERVYYDASGRKLSPFEVAGLEATSGPATSATGETVYYKLDVQEDKTSSSSPTTTYKEIQPSPQKTAFQKTADYLRSNVIAPAKEGFTLQRVGDKYRMDDVRPVSRISYAAGLVGSVATLGGAPGRAVGTRVATRISASGRLTSYAEKASTFFKSNAGKTITYTAGGAYAGVTIIKIATTPKDDRVRTLYGVGREIGTFSSFSSGLNTGFSSAAAESTYLMKANTGVMSVTEGSKTASKSVSTGQLYRLYDNKLIYEGGIRQVGRQATVATPVLTESGTPTTTFNIKGLSYTSTELKKGKVIYQASTEEGIKGVIATNKNPFYEVNKVEVGTFRTKGSIISDSEVFQRGVFSSSTSPTKVTYKGVYAESPTTTTRTGLNSVFTDRIVIQAKTNEISYKDVLGSISNIDSSGGVSVSKVGRGSSLSLQQTIGRTPFQQGITTPTIPITTTGTTPIVFPVQKEVFKTSQVSATVPSTIVKFKTSIAATTRQKNLYETSLSSASATATTTTVTSLLGSRSATRSITSTATATSPVSDITSTPVSIIPSTGGGGVPPPPVVVPPPVVSFSRLKIGGGSGKTQSFFKYSSSGGYTPSAAALALGIKGKRPKSYRSGLGVRPI